MYFCQYLAFLHFCPKFKDSSVARVDIPDYTSDLGDNVPRMAFKQYLVFCTCIFY